MIIKMTWLIFLIEGQLVQVTVPYSQASIYREKAQQWEQIYRLYYGSNHWVVGVDEGPDGQAWYRIRDDLTKDEYHAAAKHFRPILADELQPISPDVPLASKHIEVSIANQMVTAYEYGDIVRQMKISSGLIKSVAEGEIPTATPKGSFHIVSKMPSKHMGGGQLTNDLEAYILPGVPWVSFFEWLTPPETTPVWRKMISLHMSAGGVSQYDSPGIAWTTLYHPDGQAIHSVYWHNNFGSTMSHGCINMTNADAKWVYLWSLPVVESKEWLHKGFGTRVVVT